MDYNCRSENKMPESMLHFLNTFYDGIFILNSLHIYLEKILFKILYLSKLILYIFYFIENLI